MIKKLLAIALVGLLPFVGAAKAYAEEPPPEVGATAPDDPDAQPYPPDGVTDPNATYPTDGSEGTDQGEAGAEPPAAAAPSDAAPADGAPKGTAP